MNGCLISVILLFSIAAAGQQRLASVEIPGTPDEVNGMKIGDDIFISSATNVKKLGHLRKSVLIRPNGEKIDIDLSPLNDKVLVAGVLVRDSIYFYYLSTNDELIELKTILASRQTGGYSTYGKAIDLPSQIYGTYIEDGDLYIICAVAKEYNLRLLRIHNGKLVKETIFELSFDLGKRKKARTTFFDATQPVSPAAASGLIKISRDKDAIWIVADEPPGDFEEITDASVFRTTVIKLNPSTGQVQIKSFFEKSRFTFTSYLYRGNLYRVVSENTPRIDQFNFESGQLIQKNMLTRGADPGRDSTYARISQYVRTEKDVKGAYIIKRPQGQILIVQDLGQDEKLITKGIYGDQFFFTGAMGMGMAGLLTSAILSDVTSLPLSTNYWFFKGNMDKGFTATYTTPLISQIIDNYEYRMLRQRMRFDYKGYIQDGPVTYALYQMHNANTLEILKFQK